MNKPITNILYTSTEKNKNTSPTVMEHMTNNHIHVQIKGIDSYMYSCACQTVIFKELTLGKSLSGVSLTAKLVQDSNTALNKQL